MSSDDRHAHDPFSTRPDPRTYHPSAPSAPTAAPAGRGRTRRYATIGVAAGLLGGGAVGAMLGAPGLSAASPSPVPVQQDDADTEATDGDTSADEVGCDRADGPGPGTGRPGGLGGPGGFGGRGLPAFDGEVVADIIGIDAETLREQLRDGSSLAEIAESNGIDPQTVVDALIDEASDHLALAVEHGRLTDAEAAERLAKLGERIEARIDAVPGRD